MPEPRHILALAGPAQSEPMSLIAQMAPILVVFAIFYFILILPMKNKQKKVDEMQKSLKAGDKVVVSPGILGTVVAVEDNALVVRIAEQTKIKVLRSAVAGLQGQPIETEKK